MPAIEPLEKILKEIKGGLDSVASPKTPVSILYAFNASGKTRLSKLFYDKYKGKVLYYNAFTEDLFRWDNEDYTIKFNKNAWIFELIKNEGLDRQIIDNFKKFTGSKLEPLIDIPEDKNKPEGQIIFSINSGESHENIKISRGEESVFIWSVLFTVLENAIEALNETADNRTTKAFDKIEYVVIDDPVSSIDDSRIITVALELAEIISKSNNSLKFLITTHHALFYSILSSSSMGNCSKKRYILSKTDSELNLKETKEKEPFAYHHLVRSEIDEAIKSNNLRKYHFNLFRTLLEKTANFLGYSEGWKNLLPENDNKKSLIKTIDNYSHNSLSDMEYKDLPDSEKEAFVGVYKGFIEEFKWVKNQ